MVNTVLRPRTQAPLEPQVRSQPASICPRCDADLLKTYDEPQCLQCGYVDYLYTPPQRRVQGLVSSATRLVLRYVGEFSGLQQTLTNVELKRVNNRAVMGVTCPFCTQPMDQSPPSGGKRQSTEKRYRCVRGHRVALIEDDAGVIGWK